MDVATINVGEKYPKVAPPAILLIEKMQG